MNITISLINVWHILLTLTNKLQLLQHQKDLVNIHKPQLLQHQEVTINLNDSQK